MQRLGTFSRRHLPLAAFAGLVLAGAITALVSAGASAPAAPSGGGQATARAAGGGKVRALYAGSLVAYMEGNLAPSFEKASGYGFEGFGGGSTELANELEGGVRQGDVFVGTG